MDPAGLAPDGCAAENEHALLDSQWTPRDNQRQMSACKARKRDGSWAGPGGARSGFCFAGVRRPWRVIGRRDVEPRVSHQTISAGARRAQGKAKEGELGRAGRGAIG